MATTKLDAPKPCYERTEFEGGGGGTAESPRDRKDEKVVLGRSQLYF
jgi:hypothetical protein